MFITGRPLGHAQGAIGAGTGKKHTDGAFPLDLGKGAHEVIDGHVTGGGLGAPFEA